MIGNSEEQEILYKDRGEIISESHWKVVRGTSTPSPALSGKGLGECTTSA